MVQSVQGTVGSGYKWPVLAYGGPKLIVAGEGLKTSRSKEVEYIMDHEGRVYLSPEGQTHFDPVQGYTGRNPKFHAGYENIKVH